MAADKEAKNGSRRGVIALGASLLEKQIACGVGRRPCSHIPLPLLDKGLTYRVASGLPISFFQNLSSGVHDSVDGKYIRADGSILEPEDLQKLEFSWIACTYITNSLAYVFMRTWEIELVFVDAPCEVNSISVYIIKYHTSPPVGLTNRPSELTTPIRAISKPLTVTNNM